MSGVQDVQYVLVVDDEPLVADMVEHGLREAEFAVIGAATGEEAVAILENQTADILGLVTDVNLGRDMNGFAVARRARELVADLPVIYMTGDGAGAWASQGVPASVLVPKPFVTVQIVTALAALLNVESP